MKGRKTFLLFYFALGVDDVQFKNMKSHSRKYFFILNRMKRVFDDITEAINLARCLDYVAFNCVKTSQSESRKEFQRTAYKVCACLQGHTYSSAVKDVKVFF